ncbi:MAG: hypothetical protein ABIH53_01935, partial [archaeon]
MPICKFLEKKEDGYVCHHPRWELEGGYSILQSECKNCQLRPQQTESNFPTSNVSEIKTLDQLKMVIEESFPSVWFETKACLSAYVTLCLKNLNSCPSLNLVGNPAGEKTTVLSFLYGYDHTYLTDEFTPKAFVSHATNVKKEELSNIDLLPRIRNKVLVTPELAPLFKAPKDVLLVNFSTLT